MELWTQTQPFALTRRSLRHDARDHDGGRIAVERLLKACITSVHVRNQNTLGSAPPCIDGRACLSLGGNRMDGLASCFSAATRTCFVFDRALAGLSAARLFHLVVQVRCLRADDIHARRGHRRARWADTKEVRRAGLLGPDGVVLGRLGDRYLRHDGPEHVLCFAPTRSGKGVGLVIPTLLTWPSSTIVHDIKGENFQLTSGWRACFGPVLLFDPTNQASAAYNPLLEIRKGDCEVRDAQNIADILVDPEGALERRNHWEKTSHSLLVGAILHVIYAEADKTLAGVANFLSDPSRPIEATLNAMLATPHLGERAHPVVASSARELLNKSENERSGVLSTTMSFLGLYRDPVVAKVTGR